MFILHKIIQVIIPVILIVSIACSGNLNQSNQVQHRSFIIVGDEAIKLVKHCTDAYITGVSEYWVPSEENVLALEMLLPSFLNSRREGLGNYLRQYTGVIKDNRRLIFINGFHSSFLDNFAKGQDVSKEAIVLCGGGDLVYGLEYDLDARSFNNFAFNAAR